MVRTLAEVNADRVRVTVELLDQPEDGRTVRGREPGYWADACEKAENRVHELEQRVAFLEGANKDAEADKDTLYLKLVAAQQAREIETKRAEGLSLTVQGYDRDRHTERDRADRAQARVSELETSLARYVKAHVCTDRCTPDAHVAFEGNRMVKDLEAELARRFTEAEVEAAKAGAREDARAQLDREVIKPLNEKLSRIHAAVLSTELAREITTYRDSSAATLLVEALTEVRRITGVTSV